MKTKTSKSMLPSTYAPLLADLRATQVKAATAVNRELILLYWHIGREILRAQKDEGWGAKVVERLAKDLAAEFPEMGGFSRTNNLRMRAFASTWEPMETVPHAVGQFDDEATGDSIVPQAVGQSRKTKAQQLAARIVSPPVSRLEDALPEPLAQLTWSSNIILLEKLKDPPHASGMPAKPWNTVGAGRC